MANGKIRFGKQSGGQLALVIPDGVANTEVTLPESGELATKDYADLKQSKSELAYNVDTGSYIPNTLASGAIIERGSNANGEYVKYADGTLICYYETLVGYTCSVQTGGIFSVSGSGAVTLTFPVTFAFPPKLVLNCIKTGGDSVPWATQATPTTTAKTGELWLQASTNTATGTYKYLAIGRWK